MKDLADQQLTPEEKKYLLELARKTVAQALAGARPDLPDPPSPTLKEKRGAFVTLHTRSSGQLRGCIGYVEAIKPLAQSVQEMSLAAALRDPRFYPVKARELPDLKVEISVLSPLQKISDIKEIQVGQHGLVIRRGGFSGLLLPQVATEYNWSREEFLGHTCQKAGLPSDAWKQKDAAIYIFSAEVFGEEK